LRIIDSSISVAVDDLLLERRHALGADLDAEVAARDHHRVGGGDDRLEVVEDLGPLELRDDRLRASVVLDEAPDLEHVVDGSDEGLRDPVDAELDHGGEVGAILVGDAVGRDADAGQVDALARGRAAAGLDAADDLAGRDVRRHDLEADRAVVDEDRRAGDDVLSEARVDNGQHGVVRPPCRDLGLDAGDAGDQDDLAAGQHDDALVDEQAEPDLRPLQVTERAHEPPLAGGEGPDQLDAGAVVVDGAVREVEPEHVDTGGDGRREPRRVVQGGAQRRDDLDPAQREPPEVRGMVRCASYGACRRGPWRPGAPDHARGRGPAPRP
jgi:hypothetical protein